jgi:hypothetical protein
MLYRVDSRSIDSPSFLDNNLVVAVVQNDTCDGYVCREAGVLLHIICDAVALTLLPMWPATLHCVVLDVVVDIHSCSSPNVVAMEATTRVEETTTPRCYLLTGMLLFFVRV